MIKMKFANILIAFIMGSFVSAKAQYSYTAVFMDVGEEKTINLPSSVTNKDIIESYWSNDSPTYVKITRQSDYSVTIKILKYTSVTCLVQYDYYWGSSREHGNFSIRIDIKKPQSLVLSASPSGGTVAAGTSVKLEVTFNGNNVSSVYGALMVGANPTVELNSGVQIYNFKTSNPGGGITSYLDQTYTGATITLNGASVSSNSAPNGGGIYVANGTNLVMNGNSHVSNNITSGSYGGSGGGIYGDSGSNITINNYFCYHNWNCRLLLL